MSICGDGTSICFGRPCPCPDECSGRGCWRGNDPSRPDPPRPVVNVRMYGNLAAATAREQEKVFKPSALMRAHKLVHDERQSDYGHPADDFSRTAALWRALFGWDADAKDVALAMVCVKLSRLQASPEHHDSIVDAAGYMETYRMVMERQA